MGIELRHIGEDEFKPLVRAVGLGFGMQVDEDTVAALSRPLRLGRTIAALDDGEIVGGATVFSLDMNTPPFLKAEARLPPLYPMWPFCLRTAGAAF